MGQYVLLTGASSGAGRELAIQLSKNYSLILNGRNYERLLETREKCHNKESILIWDYDLSKINELEENLKLWIIENGVEIVSYIHCAGVLKMLPCKVISVEAIEETYRVNVFAAALIVKLLTAKKINGKNLKSVVFISSNISNRGAKAFSLYGSSKSAIDGLMRNLAMELAPQVRVNSVLPGGMKTEMTKEMFEDLAMKERISQNYPLGIGTPKQIAPLVEFLISENANWITGQQFVVDGGRTINLAETV
ncbi:MAG: SDR family oxidoreductase [Bacteroidales bacterium]|nr:SDR family oxidoreductase [Clostridium sp.]MCM1203855.1 SDR family oxidoreductase [Bacteroidales bacterium]